MYYPHCLQSHTGLPPCDDYSLFLINEHTMILQNADTVENAIAPIWGNINSHGARVGSNNFNDLYACALQRGDSTLIQIYDYIIRQTQTRRGSR